MESNYINLPVLAKYYIFEDFSIEAGPQIGFLLNAEHEVEGDYDSSRDMKEDMKKDFKSTDLV